jgi:hypothetical protein
MHVLGIDIAKHVFHALGMDEKGQDGVSQALVAA